MVYGKRLKRLIFRFDTRIFCNGFSNDILWTWNSFELAFPGLFRHSTFFGSFFFSFEERAKTKQNKINDWIVVLFLFIVSNRLVIAHCVYVDMQSDKTCEHIFFSRFSMKCIRSLSQHSYFVWLSCIFLFSDVDLVVTVDSCDLNCVEKC